MQLLSRGVLISLEGIDGSGKTTLTHNLAQALSDQQLPVVITKEPGGSALGKQLRTIVQTQAGSISAKAEFLLFAADRAQHFDELIMPGLHANNIVISDRMADSSLVYQGYGRGLDRATLTIINQWAMQGRLPDVTIYVRIRPEIAHQRLLARKKTLTAFEQEQQSFFNRLVSGYEELYKNRSDVIIVEGEQQEENVAHEAVSMVTKYLKNNNIIK
ncbi:MAG TPA: dTMP kinase [Candidatus Limnocylindria bacterium]|nr:dTMP kinase [Candidatus Limnocylindria bacterium]